ncbi:hypothetical protein KFK09_010287 [Dendrobium nobile]|uniref:Uncharacterized protein n=1 Tax=Dendrobium nobile TaxID=94219 RepID=A0A8T3BLR3_DENNO|nr:hypothetical protein KFK09_010287 [Dendrobium nobile]
MMRYGHYIILLNCILILYLFYGLMRCNEILQIIVELKDVTDDEKLLLLLVSPPASPIRVASPPTTAESSPPTPSPVRLSSDPKHDSAPPTQTQPESSAHIDSTNVDDETNLRILSKSIFELFSKFNFINNKVTAVEATNHILEQRILFLEKENIDLKERIGMKDRFMMQFFEKNFPSYVKSYKKELCPGSSLSPTASEDTTLSEYEVDTTVRSGIAQRVQRRNDRKRKLVSTPFTTGITKKKIKRKKVTKDDSGNAIASDQPDKIPEKAPILTPTPALQPKTEPTPVIPVGPTVVTPAEPEQANVTAVEMPSGKEIVVYEVDENKEIPLNPAAETLDYPGRNLIADDKRLIIDNALKQFKFM